MISNAEIKGGLCFVTISDTGLSHRLSGKANQDCVSYAVENGDFVIVVSDGVGSCSKAEDGSRFAVEAVLKIFSNIRNAELVAVEELPELIINEWLQLIGDNNKDDYCATVKAAIKIGNKMNLISIGDGLLALTSEGMHVIAPENNSLFINHTVCLNSQVKASDFWTHEFEVDVYVPYVILVCTDGVANGIQQGQELELVRTIEKEMKAEELREELEKLVVSIAEYSFDDRTVGVVKYEWKDAEPDR